MARGAEQESLLFLIVRLVVRADGIVCAQSPEIERLRGIVDPIRGFDQTAERALGVWTRGIEQDPSPHRRRRFAREWSSPRIRNRAQQT